MINPKSIVTVFVAAALGTMSLTAAHTTAKPQVNKIPNGIETTVNGNEITLSKAVTVKEGDIICGDGAGKDGSAVFCTLFLGENAYGVTDIEGGGLEHIVKQRGYGNDPLNQRSSVGWKATKVAKRLLEEYMIRFESGSAFSATAESN